MTTPRCRPLLLAAAVAALVLAGALPANAHVEATVVDGGQAGAGPVGIRFDAAAESSSAGITGVKTQLPEGLLP